MSWRGAAPQARPTPDGRMQRAPNQAQGYYTGYGPVYGGSGSGMGQAVAGTGTLAQGNGVNIAGQSWHPTVLYLIALVLAEMIVFGFIGNLLK